ncbi:2-succinylbenzoate--CoA ligase [Sinobacterium norvegicum]|uniref:2-succinylbenzoate--CoA ligase n=1 Tax=Sinobacterium norvegicum TaxID=1641715 RepID=A0ABM9AA24_9GAMM|nr:AMP-binding protein [Sinobacterium norvegicum]CAH0989968.1 2-succinylbenzoate--CoA ligase [Sinobacterium norvegicum]
MMLLQSLADNTAEFAVNDGDQSIDFPALVQRANRVYSYLKAQGIGSEHHVAMMLDNRIENIEIMLAVLMSGAWLTPINWHLTRPEIDYIIDDSGAELLFYQDCFCDQIDLDKLAQLVNLDSDYSTIITQPVTHSASADDPAGGMMIYTSGTTGYPKGVKRAKAATLGQLFAAFRSGGSNVGLDGNGVHLVTGPMYHAAPALYALYDLLNGTSLYLMQRFDVLSALALIERYKVTHSHWVPTMFVRLLKLPKAQRQGFDTSSLTLVLHGAAPITPSIKQQMLDEWGDVLVEYWGGTEGGVTTIINSQQWRDHPGSVGKALPQFEVFAIDHDDQRLPPGQPGLLYAKHQSLGRVFEYHNAKQKTDQAHLVDGAFTLGDMGYVDEQGYVYLSDRRSNLIISGGVNIYPAEIEGVLIEHPDISDIGVFGVDDEEWGQSVVAVIEPSATADIDDLADDLPLFCQSRLAKYKIPKVFHIIEKLPRTPAGKLYIRRIKDQFGG